MSEHLTQSVTLNLNNIQLTFGKSIICAYGGAGADGILGGDGNDALRNDSAACTIQPAGWLLSELNQLQNQRLTRVYN